MKWKNKKDQMGGNYNEWKCTTKSVGNTHGTGYGLMRMVFYTRTFRYKSVLRRKNEWTNNTKVRKLLEKGY